jgi:putative PIN family toxin of toxin-antitoxin system
MSSRHSSHDSVVLVAAHAPVWVLDTNVVLDWLIFADPGVAALVACIEGRDALLVTREDCRAELVRVLQYRKLPANDSKRTEALAIYDRWASTWVGAALELHLPECRDPHDQKFLELARDARATWLISKDKLVLKLARRTQALGLFQVLHPRLAARLLHADGELAVSSNAGRAPPEVRTPKGTPDPGAAAASDA